LVEITRPSHMPLHSKKDVKNAQEDHPDGAHQYHRTRNIMSSS